MNNNRSFLTTIACVGAFGALLLVAAGCSHHNTTPPSPTPTPVAPVAQSPANVTIYKVARNKTEQQKADPNGLVAVTVPIASNSSSPAQDALSSLASEPSGPLPKGTKVISLTVDSQTGLATADFSPEFQKNFPGGDTAEAQVISSVLQVLGQFPNIQNVQFLVNGQKIASLGGTQDLDEPLPVVRPATSGSKENVAMQGGGSQ